MTFVPGGLGEYHDSIWAWAPKHSNLVDTINVSQKGSGRARYMKVTYAAQESNNTTNLTDSMEFMVEGIVNHELKLLNEEVDNFQRELLTEGIFSDIGKAVANTFKKVKDAVTNFFIRTFNKIVGRLKQLVQDGVDKFMSFVGIELSGGYVRSPW